MFDGAAPGLLVEVKRGHVEGRTDVFEGTGGGGKGSELRSGRN